MDLIEKIKSRAANIGIIGLGYVGLPLVIRHCEEGFRVTGFDIDLKKVEKLNRGESYIRHIPSEKIKIDKGQEDIRGNHGLFEAERYGLCHNLCAYTLKEE